MVSHVTQKMDFYVLPKATIFFIENIDPEEGFAMWKTFQYRLLIAILLSKNREILFLYARVNLQASFAGWAEEGSWNVVFGSVLYGSRGAQHGANQYSSPGMTMILYLTK